MPPPISRLELGSAQRMGIMQRRLYLRLLLTIRRVPGTDIPGCPATIIQSEHGTSGARDTGLVHPTLAQFGSGRDTLAVVTTTDIGGGAS